MTKDQERELWLYNNLLNNRELIDYLLIRGPKISTLLKAWLKRVLICINPLHTVVLHSFCKLSLKVSPHRLGPWWGCDTLALVCPTSIRAVTKHFSEQGHLNTSVDECHHHLQK